VPYGDSNILRCKPDGVGYILFRSKHTLDKTMVLCVDSMVISANVTVPGEGSLIKAM